MIPRRAHVSDKRVYTPPAKTGDEGFTSGYNTNKLTVSSVNRHLARYMNEEISTSEFVELLS